jgi:hypothetical protein
VRTREDNDKICERLGLKNGQFFGKFRYKNLKWQLDDIVFGYGDLTDDQLLHIAETLESGEKFVGWNEHQWTNFQQSEMPMVVITSNDILFRQEIMAAMNKEK